MLSRKQELTVLNLDELVEEIVEVGRNRFEEISYEKLEAKMMENPHTVQPEDEHYFALFKLIHEEPKKAINLLEKAAENQIYGRDYTIPSEIEYFKKAKEAKEEFVIKAGEKLFETFIGVFSRPDLHWWTMSELLAVVKFNPYNAISFFEGCYRERVIKAEEYLAKEDRFLNDPYWDNYKKQLRLMVKALETRDFSKATEPHYLELRLVPKKEKMEVPKGVNVEDWASLSSYLQKLEHTPLEITGFIRLKAVIIPRQGLEDWSKGLYVITFLPENMKVDKVYKTEKPHTDEEIVAKTTGKGYVRKFDRLISEKAIKEGLEALKKCLTENKN